MIVATHNDRLAAAMERTLRLTAGRIDPAVVGAAPRLGRRVRRRGRRVRAVDVTLWLLAVVMALGVSLASAQEEDEPPSAPPERGSTVEAAPVSRVRIEGNIRVEEDAIRVHLQTQEGKPVRSHTRSTRTSSRSTRWASSTR